MIGLVFVWSGVFWLALYAFFGWHGVIIVALGCVSAVLIGMAAEEYVSWVGLDA